MTAVRNSFILVLTMIICVVDASAASTSTATLRSSVRVAHGAVITLADIATLDGEQAQSAGTLEIARAESGAFEISAEQVRQKLAAHAGAASSTQALITVRGERVVVRPSRGRAGEVALAMDPDSRATGASSASATRAAVKDTNTLVDPKLHVGASTPLGIVCEMLLNTWDTQRAALRLEIKDADLQQLTPRAGLRYEIAAKSALRSDRVDFEVIAYTGTKITSRERIRVLPKLESSVAIITADTRRGAHLDAACVRSETRFLAPSIAARVVEPNSIADSVLARTLPEGSIVESDDLAREVTVHRNDRVIVRREIGMIAVELEAVALEDGSMGDIIALETRGAGRGRDSKALSAEVVGRGRAVVR